MSLRLIGYWRSDSDPSLPDPAAFVDKAWDEDERHQVDWYFSHGTMLRVAMGFSRCRVCGEPNGSAEFTDGTYVWPEGLAHYVREHAVRLPNPVIEHVKRRLDELEGMHVDVDWWRRNS